MLLWAIIKERVIVCSQIRPSACHNAPFFLAGKYARWIHFWFRKRDKTRTRKDWTDRTTDHYFFFFLSHAAASLSRMFVVFSSSNQYLLLWTSKLLSVGACQLGNKQRHVHFSGSPWVYCNIQEVVLLECNFRGAFSWWIHGEIAVFLPFVSVVYSFRLLLRGHNNNDVHCQSPSFCRHFVALPKSVQNPRHSLYRSFCNAPWK